MSSGCGDVLSLADLQTAKKHQLFEAEVITGKQGGVSDGADIDYATNQVTGQIQKTMPAILRDIGYTPASFDFTTGGTLAATDRDKAVYDPVSKTWYIWQGSLPHVVAAATNPVGDSNWKPWTDPTLRAAISASDGFGIIGSLNYQGIRTYTGAAKAVQCSGLSSSPDMGYGLFYRDDTDTATPDDGGTVLVDAAGRRWKRSYNGKINVQWFGAKPDDDSASTAAVNTEAFRKACMSYKASWDAWATTGASRDVYVPAGDYNLSNGFTVPKGCSISSGGVGVARLKILGATTDSNPKLPLVSLGRAINAVGGTVVTQGAYVQDPAPSIDNIYLNPQNSNIALSIDNIPGFKVGSLWVQAETAVYFGDCNDGIVESLIIENGSVNGVRFAGAQNIIINSIYTFLCDNPIIFTGDGNNIQINASQLNYTKVAPVQFNDGVGARNIKVGTLVINQNAQFGTFTSCIRSRGAVVELDIQTMDARNYNGYAFNVETGLGTNIHIGFLKLRQAPSNPTYSHGNQAKGCRVSNCILSVDNLDVAELYASPFELTGTFPAILRVSGGVVGALNVAAVVANIDNTNASTYCYLAIEPPAGQALFNLNSVITPDYSRVKKPFPLVIESGRQAIKIPFNSTSSSWMLSISANTNSTGNPLYRRTQQWFVTREVGFNAAVVNAVAVQNAGNSSLTTGFTPDISLQADLGVVGGGAQGAYVSSGYVVLSVPSSYTGVMYNLRQLI